MIVINHFTPCSVISNSYINYVLSSSQKTDVQYVLPVGSSATHKFSCISLPFKFLFPINKTK